MSRKAAPKEASLEATAEDRQRFCSRDVLWQIVPDTRGSNRISPVADGWQPSSAHNQRLWQHGVKTATSFDVSQSAEFISEVRWGWSMLAFVDKDSQYVDAMQLLWSAEIATCNYSLYVGRMYPTDWRSSLISQSTVLLVIDIHMYSYMLTITSSTTRKRQRNIIMLVIVYVKLQTKVSFQIDQRFCLWILCKK